MKSMLNRLLAKKDAEIKEIVSSVDAAAAPRGLRRRFEKIRNKKQGGFTLLELLVVVAILATIAATATILLEDTDRKASAAAHVTIMDELTKGLSTYRVLHQGQMPDNWDSLLASDDGSIDTAQNVVIPVATGTNFGLDSGLTGMLGLEAVTANIATALTSVGIGNVQVLSLAANDPNGTNPGSCDTLADIRTMISDKASDITNSSIYKTFNTAVGASNDRAGCAVSTAVAASGTNRLARLNSTENYRVGAGANDIVIALGFGSELGLFKAENLGAMTGAPFYRHVDGQTYNRFVGLFNVGTAATPLTEARFQGVIDGSGDTKEEELAEWDNTRSTL